MNNVETMLDMYLFETTTLLEQLDELLIDAEKISNFSADDINEIFRIMHTIKGSSAMMEFNSLMSIAHKVEDLFYYIRENGVNQEYASTLFDLMFESADFLKQEIEKVQTGQPLTDNIDSFSSKINDSVEKIKNILPVELSKTTNVETTANSSVSNLAENYTYRINILYDLDSSMENLRSLMLVNSLEDVCGEFKFSPNDIETNKLTAKHISEFGFDLFFSSEKDLNSAISLVKNSTNIRNYQILDTEANAVSPIDGDTKTKITIFFELESGMENLRALMVTTALSEVVTDFKMFPEDVETNPETAKYISENGFDLILDKRSDVKKTIDVIKQSSNVRDYEVLENFVDENVASVIAVDDVIVNVKAEEKTTSHTVQNKQSLISVNLQKLDNLMNIVGEIVITESMVTSSPEVLDLNLDSFTKSARQLRKLTDELQDIVMSIRMVPVSGVFQKMNRIVRDMDKKLGKSVELVMVGEHTEVDKAIVDGISDPIMHLVRNAMDHGIESNAKDRTALGKSTTGKITLTAQHTGSDVLISVSDDGKGIDPDAILKKANSKGLLIKPIEDYSKKEALALVMMPGFSTKEQVTEFSGRGVGMDVVKKNIEKIGGTVTMNSDLGTGTSIVFKIPLTLAIASCMKVSVSNSIYAIPIMNIKQSFKAKPEDIIYDTDNNEIIKWMDTFYKVLRLHKVYDVDGAKTDLLEGIMVLVEADDKSYCMFVDELLGEQQVVVKPLPKYLSTFNIKEVGIGGCTILGDGQISLILDVFNLYNIS